MPADSFEDQIINAARIINASSHLIAFTGAGISTSSGIPDFRGEKEGLWQRYNPIQVASHNAFVHKPELFFDWFRPLFLTAWHAKPNPAHKGLAVLENLGILKFVITQNIDGLHQKAGSKKVCELHGSALTFSCPSCLQQFNAQAIVTQFLSGAAIPRCPVCGQIIKPDVVLFEEPLPEVAFEIAVNECLQSDVMLIIGSSLEVYPAASLPATAAKHGSRIILNNLSPTPLDRSALLRIPLDAAEFLPRLLQQLSL